MCFANGTPKSLYDKTDGWERRLIILSAKPVPKDRITDPFLSEKLLGEKEGIFLSLRKVQGVKTEMSFWISRVAVLKVL